MLTPEDVDEINKVLADHGHVVDDHDWDRAGEVFADDFVFDMGGTGRPDLHGIADIVANFKGRNMYAHVTTNVSITQGPDGAVRVHSKFLGVPQRRRRGDRRLPRRDGPHQRWVAHPAPARRAPRAQVLRLEVPAS